MTISSSILQEFDTASEAHQVLRQDMLARVAQTKSLDYMAQKITFDLTNILARLQTEIEECASKLSPEGAIQPLEMSHHFVIADSFGGNVMVRRYPDGGLVVVDRNFFLLLVCYVFFQSRPDVYGPKLAAWMLLHSTILPAEPFPLLDAFYLFAIRLDPTLVNDLCRSVGFLFLAHELGHRHALEHGVGYLRALALTPGELENHKANINDFRLHEDGAIYSTLVDGQQPPILLFQKDQARWIDEFYADIFACYLHVARSPRPDDGLESLVNQLCVWQQILRLLDLRQQYQDRAPGLLLSHPSSTMRMDSMVHHFEKLSLEFAPDFRSSTLNVLQRQYYKTWSAAFFETWSNATTLAFYTIDATALHPHVVKMRGKGERTWAPGLFRRFLEDFAVPAVRKITQLPDHDVEIAWGRQLDEFNLTCNLNNQPVLDQLAQELRDIGLEF